MNVEGASRRQKFVTFEGVHKTILNVEQIARESKFKKQHSLPKICDYAFGPKCLGKTGFYKMQG